MFCQGGCNHLKDRVTVMLEDLGTVEFRDWHPCMNVCLDAKYTSNLSFMSE